MAQPRTLSHPAMAQLGPLIRLLRQERRMSFARFVELSGMSAGYLTRLELGGGNPTLETLIKIATALGVRPHELLVIY